MDEKVLKKFKKSFDEFRKFLNELDVDDTTEFLIDEIGDKVSVTIVLYEPINSRKNILEVETRFKSELILFNKSIKKIGVEYILDEDDFIDGEDKFTFCFTLEEKSINC